MRLPFDLFIFQVTETILDLRDIHILSPRFLALTGGLGELLRCVNGGRHHEGSICQFPTLSWNPKSLFALIDK